MRVRAGTGPTVLQSTAGIGPSLSACNFKETDAVSMYARRPRRDYPSIFPLLDMHFHYNCATACLVCKAAVRLVCRAPSPCAGSSDLTTIAKLIERLCQTVERGSTNSRQAGVEDGCRMYAHAQPRA